MIPVRPFGPSICFAWIPASVVLVVLLLTGTAQPVHALDRTWIGGNANWDTNTANWNPADEPDSDDTAIFNTPNSVSLALDNAILGLVLSGGIDLSTSGSDLNVDGLVQLSGTSTTLIVGGSNSLLSADGITIDSGGILRLAGGVVAIAEESGNSLLDINAGGTLTGNGALTFNDAVAANTTLLINDGMITAASTTPNDIFSQSAATLMITGADPDAEVDLDGAGESGIVSVSANDTLDVNGTLSDPFSGTLNLGPGATIRMSNAWLGVNATINANTANAISGTPGTAATIAGAEFSLNSGTISLDDVDSLRFVARFTANSGTISNAGHVIFNSSATIAAGAKFLMIGNVASLTVNTNATVNIDDPAFNLDGGGSAGNIVTINSGGVLDLDLGAGADESLTGTINLNGGELDVTTGDNNWAINGIVNVGTNTGVSQVNGEEVTITGATVTIGADSTLELNAVSVWAAAGHLVVHAGAVADLNGGFEPGSLLTLHAGTCRSTSAMDFSGALSVGLPGDSTLQIGGPFVFENGSTTTLSGSLRLNNLTTIVQPGASFTGAGALINRPGWTLQLQHGIASGDLNVLVQNEGVLQLGPVNSDAQVRGAGFQQSVSGTLQIDIGGTALSDFDRFTLTGAAALSGELNLSLLGGFVPTLGQTFDILTATAISGTFTTIRQPVGMPVGTTFAVSYSPLAVRLTVMTPYEAWINSFPSLTIPADKLKTADPDNDGANNLVEFALDGNPTNAVATGKVVAKVAPVGGVEVLTLTFPIRAGVTLDPADPIGGPYVLEQIGDAVSYRIEASENLAMLSWTLEVTVVAGADAMNIQSGLPALNPGWVYRTFRSPGSVVSDPEEFMRLVIGE